MLLNFTMDASAERVQYWDNFTIFAIFKKRMASRFFSRNSISLSPENLREGKHALPDF